MTEALKDHCKVVSLRVTSRCKQWQVQLLIMITDNNELTYSPRAM